MTSGSATRSPRTNEGCGTVVVVVEGGLQPVLLGAWSLQVHTSAAVCMMFTAFLCLLVHVDRPDICRLEVEPTTWTFGHVDMSGYVRICLDIWTVWTCLDISVLTVG